jgi:hypothetical protein
VLERVGNKWMNAERSSIAGELIAARVIESRPTLKADQRELVRRLLANPERVAVVIGEAGTGKTFPIVAAAEGWRRPESSRGSQRPTWRAANVLRSDGLPPDGRRSRRCSLHGRCGRASG